jgi:hypothetical protein
MPTSSKKYSPVLKSCFSLNNNNNNNNNNNIIIIIIIFIISKD